MTNFDSPWSRGRINACQAFEPSSSLGGEKSPLTQLVECTTVNRDARSSILLGRVGALLAQLVAHRSDKAAVNGSIPLESTFTILKNAFVAHQAERGSHKAKVMSSILIEGTGPLDQW